MKITMIKSTPFGAVAVIWTLIGVKPKVARVILSRPGFSAEKGFCELFPEAETVTSRLINAGCSEILASFSGRKVRFSLDLAQLDICSPFQQAVLFATHGIPCGRVSTYNLLAVRLGRPGAARAVGHALASNPFPIIVPCHRAIRTDRTLGGYQGGLAMKHALLAAEGIRFDRKGRVVSGPLHYGTTANR